MFCQYLQSVSSDPNIVNCVAFNGFLLAAQQETKAEKVEEVNLDIFLMNEYKITIKGMNLLQTEEILEVLSYF